MSKIANVVLGISVALAVFYGARMLRQREAGNQLPATAIAEKMQQLKARAEREHPDMAKSDALKKVATEESASDLAKLSGSERANTAASMFWGFHAINTRTRVDYCRTRGVDLSRFTEAFTREHAAELARAHAIYALAGVDPESVIAQLLPQFPPVVEQDMKDVAAGAKVPVDQACQLFNDHAEQLAAFIKLPPHVNAALMEGQ